MTLSHSLEWSLAALCAALAAIAAYEYEVPIQPFRPPAVSLTVRPLAAEADFYSPPSEAAFSSIDERPIFNPTRKAVEAAPTPEGGVGAPPPPPNATLVGVIADAQNKLALVKEQGSVFATSLAVGSTIDGWQVAEIDADRVLLRAGAAQATLTMYGTRTEASPTARTAPTAPSSAGPYAPGAAPGAAVTTGR